MDWEALSRREVSPPILIDLAADTDTKHFDQEFTRMPLHSFGNFYSKAKDEERPAAASWQDAHVDPDEFAFEASPYSDLLLLRQTMVPSSVMARVSQRGPYTGIPPWCLWLYDLWSSL